MNLITVIGARPQFIKAAPFSKIFRQKHHEILVHTGQHYDPNMSEVFFRELGIPQPDYNLGVGSESHGRMTGRMLEGIEAILLDQRPDAVLVYGDTNSTLAGALAAAKLLIPVVHVEAGLRSYNMDMPEEQNRVLTDHVATLLLCPTETAVNNLKKEGLSRGVHNSGDIMYDAVLNNIKLAEQKQNWAAYLNDLTPTGTTTGAQLRSVSPGGYYLATVHRAENTAAADRLGPIMAAFNSLDLPVLFPVHPRTRRLLDGLGMSWPRVLMVEPVGYLAMLVLVSNARKVLTDSGGLQKEAYFLGTPCVTLREQTEWVETLADGWNVLATIDPETIITLAQQPFLPQQDPPKGAFGDGQAARRMVALVENIRMERDSNVERKDS